MIAEGESAEPVLEALVLVDVTPTLKREGVAKILGFMGENADQGFASLEEAADAIAAYLPHRPRPSSLTGLAKNLRLHDDGRYRWHWDPAFLSQREAPTETDWQTRENRLIDAASQLRLPVLLVRGQQSELVDMAAVNNCLSLIPHAQFADVHNAGHMVAGDKNDVFGDAVVTFLDTLGQDHRNHQS
jgi:pimeloyl-ACP methyl ester carboxylesterase